MLRLRFTEDLTQTEIAKRLGVSQMQVSRQLRRSLVRLSPRRPSPPSHRRGGNHSARTARRDDQRC
jgi:DNA-directed RNA polymerase specialized sigma24 family protein